MHLLTYIIILLCFASPIYGRDKLPIGIESVVEHLRLRDQALDSFEIKGQEYIVGEDGNRVFSGVYFEFTYALASGGRVELRNLVYNPGTKTPFLDWYRDDGQKIYKMGSTEKNGEVIDSVYIRLTPNLSSENRVGKNIVMHALTPLGLNLANLVSTAKNPLTSETTEGDRHFSITAYKGKASLDLVLSERHGFLPVKIDFGNGYVIHVLEFQSINGFWFPKKAEQTMKQIDGKTMKLVSLAESIKVNFNVSDKRFGIPDLEPGAEVHDETTNSHYIYGAPKNDSRTASRIRASFERKYRDPTPRIAAEITSNDAQSRSKTVRLETRASRHAEQSATTRWAIVISISAIALAIVLTLRVNR